MFVAVALASLGYINDVWFYFSYIGGDLLPTFAFGLLVLGLLVNPLLGMFRFKPGEWVVMLALAFMGSTLAGSAFYWQAPHPMITPIQDQLSSPGWKEKDLLQYVPDVMLADARPAADGTAPDALRDYMQGINHQGKYMAPIRMVPWRAWAPTMAFWTALLSLTFIGGAAAVVVVHRQWSKREQLAYPIVTFTNELLGSGEGVPGEMGELRPRSIFRRRVFWVGLSISLLILLINGYYVWNPGSIQVATTIDGTSLTDLSFFKTLSQVPGVGSKILTINIYFAAIGVAFFLTSEASFSMGISGWLYALIVAPLIARGSIDLTQDMLGGGVPSYVFFGAYLGMGIMVLYLGRRFYWAVTKRAAFLKDRRGEVLPHEATAMRVLLLIAAGLVGLLWWVGLHPVLGAAFVALTGLLFLMLARVNASTGMFMMQPFWQPVSIVVGLFGATAIGPHALAIMAILCTMVSIDTRIAAVPLIANALKLADDHKVNPGRMASWMVIAIIAALVISLTFTIWLVYSKGANTGRSSPGTNWAMRVARKPFKMLDASLDTMEGNYQLEYAREGTHLLDGAIGTEGNRALFPGRKDHVFTAIALGMALVLGCSWMRLRFSRWPLHPALFLIWGQAWVADYAPSFMIAWLAKGMIMKYGGQKMYARAKSFFVGLVAGELLAALIWVLVGAIYFLITRTEGQHFLTRQ